MPKIIFTDNDVLEIQNDAESNLILLCEEMEKMIDSECHQNGE